MDREQDERYSASNLDGFILNVIRSLLRCLNANSETVQQRPDRPALLRHTVPPALVHASAQAAAPPHAPYIPHVSLHQLGSSSVAGRPYTTEMANDLLGIVAEYLPQTDQLGMRQVSPSVRVAVDPKVRTLTLTALEACALFSQPGDFTHLRELHLCNCHDAELIQFAEILTLGRNAGFTLVLDGQEDCLISEAGLRSLRSVALGGISLENIQISREVVEALSLGTSPVSIILPCWRANQAKPELIGSIPTLNSLSANKLLFSDATVSLLRSHHYLSDLTVSHLNEQGFRDIIASPTLRALAVEKIHGDPYVPI